MPKTSFTKQQVKRFREIEKIQQGRGEEGLHKLFDALIERVEREYDIKPVAFAPKENVVIYLERKMIAPAWWVGDIANIEFDKRLLFFTALICFSLVVPACITIFWSLWSVLVGHVPVVQTITMSRTWEAALPFAISRWWDIPAAIIITPTLIVSFTSMKKNAAPGDREALIAFISFFIIELVCLKIWGVRSCLFFGGAVSLGIGTLYAFTEDFKDGVLLSVCLFLFSLGALALCLGVFYSIALSIVALLVVTILFFIFIKIVD